MLKKILTIFYTTLSIIIIIPLTIYFIMFPKKAKEFQEMNQLQKDLKEKSFKEVIH